MKKIFMFICLFTVVSFCLFADVSEDLLNASEKGDIAKVKKLIENGADVSYQKFSVRNGYTALMLASEGRHKEIVEILLSAKAEPNAQMHEGYSALSFASYNGNADIVKLLIKAKANLDLQDEDGRTALIYASYQGYTEIVKSLIKARAKINIKNKDGRALTYARNDEIKELLIKAGAK